MNPRRWTLTTWVSVVIFLWIACEMADWIRRNW